MANITERVGKDGKVSYLIRVFVDQRGDGTQTVKSKTWKPEPGMTKRQIQKELNKQATLFEEGVRTGFIPFAANTKFEDYAARWMENAQVSPTTRARYEDMLVRINQAIGHVRLDKLQAHHLETFYQSLREIGTKEKGRFAASEKLGTLLKEKKMSKAQVARMAGISDTTVCTACTGKRISTEKAKQIADALGMPLESLFEVNTSTTGLAEKTILHHHQLISSILGKAKRERIVPFNVASEHATAPKPPRKEADYLTDEQAQQIVELLFYEEDIRVKTALLVLLYSGVRRGELCGLSWPDIESEKGIIHIRRASQYQRKKGVVEVPTKNYSSIRVIKMPQIIFDVLSDYRIWWLEQKIKNGSNWKDTGERLFVGSVK